MRVLIVAYCQCLLTFTGQFSLLWNRWTTSNFTSTSVMLLQTQLYSTTTKTYSMHSIEHCHGNIILTCTALLLGLWCLYSFGGLAFIPPQGWLPLPGWQSRWSGSDSWSLWKRYSSCSPRRWLISRSALTLIPWGSCRCRFAGLLLQKRATLHSVLEYMQWTVAVFLNCSHYKYILTTRLIFLTSLAEFSAGPFVASACMACLFWEE